MSTNQIKTVSLAEVLEGISSFFSYVISRLKLILFVVIALVLVATGYYFIQKPAYEGTITFILEEKTSGLGGLSGLASQVGIDIGSISGGSEIFSGDNILNILRSKTIVERAFLSKVDSMKGVQGQTLADLFFEISGYKKKWSGEEPELAGISFSQLAENKPHTLLQDSVLSVFYERIYRKHVTAERLDKKGSIIKVSTVSRSQVFSKLFTERLLAETKKYYTDIKTGVSAANIARLEKRADSLQRILANKSYQSAASQLLDANEAYRSAAVPVELSQRDKMITYAIYTEVMKNLEASRMSMSAQTPVIQVLDDTKYPLQDQRKSLLLLVLGSAVGGLVISLLFCFVMYPGKKDAAAQAS